MIATTGKPLAEFLLQDYSLERSLEPESLRQLEMSIWALDRWYGRPVQTTELHSGLVNEFLISESTRGQAPHTVNRRRGNILAIWRLAGQRGLTTQMPEGIRRMREPRRLPQAWSLDELRRMIAAAEAVEGEYPNGIRIGQWWGLFLRLGYDTGLRRSDLLEVSVAGMRHGRFEILQQKSQRSILCRVAPATIAALERTIPPDRKKALPWPYSREVFWYHWRQYVIAPAGLLVGRKEGPQKLRRTSATHLEAIRPGAAMAHLGHSTPGLAYASYVDPRFAQSSLLLPPSIE